MNNTKICPVKFDSCLLPQAGVDLHKWAVIACDQYTSDEAYWQNVEKTVGNAPSTLHLICPEIYLADADKRLGHIGNKAKEYADNILNSVSGGVLVKRTLDCGERWGLVCLIDLECYSYDPKAKALIRATEGTVPERIPPRLKVRDASVLELPHILALIDDREKTVIEPLIGTGKKLYDFKLMLGGGRIEGWQITDTAPVIAALEKLQNKTAKRYGEDLLMLVGDGNHSLATAKALYNELKLEGSPRADAARYALVEVENIWQDGIKFEPIHRVYLGGNSDKFAEFMRANFSSTDGAEKSTHSAAKMFVGNSTEQIYLPAEGVAAYEKVQRLMSEYVLNNGGEIDYIHGESDLKKLCAAKCAVGIVMPKISKDSFFDFVVKNGVMPRKTFSMGEAYEKRYYLECRNV